ncbi:MAG: hypothetical protein KJZ78_27720, partial [Bryobacteraceae bacterium]|nr:hypothetical protein [Bryobacteraceae bacterium]
LDAFVYSGRIKRVTQIRVGRSDDIRSPGIRRQAQHLNTFIEVPGAIIQIPEDVAMYIDHATGKQRRAAAPACTAKADPYIA